MSSYANHQALAGLTLRKSTGYRDTYNASLLQGVPRSPNRDSLGLKMDNLSLHGTDIWTLHEFSWLSTKGLSQVAVGHVEFDYTSIDLIELKSSKPYLDSFNQTRFNNWDGIRQTLERDLNTCARGRVSVVSYRLDELEGRPIGHLNGICIDDQDITIDNYKFTTDYLGNATNGERVVEETLVSRLLGSGCLITHQPDWGSIQVQYHGRQIDREELLRYLTPFRHHDELHEQCTECVFSDLLRFYRPGKLSVCARYTRRGGLDVNPQRGNSDFVSSITRLVRQ